MPCESTGTAEDGMARLRHDSYYDDLTYKWLGNGLVSELHFQSRAQREANITGPMVSLLHGLLGGVPALLRDRLLRVRR